METVETIKKDIEELNKRAKNTIDIDKKKDYIQGIEDIKTKYKDKYTDEALAETINTYKQDKLKGIYDTLNKFDEQSKELGKNIEERILKLEESSKATLEPKTQYDFERYNFLFSKIQNEMMNLFTDKNNNREWQLDEHIKQAKHDYLYANALLNNEGLLINNIRNNKYISNVERDKLKTYVKMNFEGDQKKQCS
ncbi:hypothetical protein [Staphylococcus epidermidis]|uniref:hypothetical protein n=1 Tax=Staphylococcus epidermidis TaxID=1282 RepID=UPI001C57C7B3|nr:hypothetical protein [Staphylococcus epidermidis]QXU91414.1 hypothetical protein KFV31_13395 [Staphylococcus epidermidis]